MNKATICECGHTAGQHHREGKHECCETVCAEGGGPVAWCACKEFVERAKPRSGWDPEAAGQVLEGSRPWARI